MRAREEAAFCLLKCLIKCVWVIRGTVPHDQKRAHLSGKPVVYFSYRLLNWFWNSTFSPVLEHIEKIFLTALAQAFEWRKPGIPSWYFYSKGIEVFIWPTVLWQTRMLMLIRCFVILYSCSQCDFISDRKYHGSRSMYVYTIIGQILD